MNDAGRVNTGTQGIVSPEAGLKPHGRGGPRRIENPLESQTGPHDPRQNSDVMNVEVCAKDFASEVGHRPSRFYGTSWVRNEVRTTRIRAPTGSAEHRAGIAEWEAVRTFRPK